MSLPVALWVLLIVYVVHDGEELLTIQGMPLHRFATPHFQVLRMPKTLVAMGVLTAWGAFCLWLGTMGTPWHIGEFLTDFWVASLFVNAVFHTSQSIKYRRYTPGAVTAVLLFFPYILYLMIRSIAEGFTSWPLLIAALVVAAISMRPRLKLAWAFADLVLGGQKQVVQY